ncbi:Lrp/AsnC family transcriptional regulator [Leisingera thetidis]|uniref:Lrp/AsnC family transcriptional regulator n=1 Tax=Leisingera thetidis TaxID=2930199 RepID=UPI0021F71D00|nr:Lrp/AsnC family transcriptional regulator [Leisingera thetidis]
MTAKHQVSSRAKRASQSIRSPGDDLNQQIIRLLQQDGRMAFSEIAQRLDVSEGTIRNRVSGLRENNMLRIVAMSDPVATEYTTDAMIGLNVAAGVTPRQVAERLEGDPRVVFILWVAGRYDLIVELVSDDAEELKEFLEQEIHASDDIANADVMLGLKNFKNQFLLKRDMPETGAAAAG